MGKISLLTYTIIRINRIEKKERKILNFQKNKNFCFKNYDDDDGKMTKQKEKKIKIKIKDRWKPVV